MKRHTDCACRDSQGGPCPEVMHAMAELAVYSARPERANDDFADDDFEGDLADDDFGDDFADDDFGNGFADDDFSDGFADDDFSDDFADDDFGGNEFSGIGISAANGIGLANDDDLCHHDPADRLNKSGSDYYKWIIVRKDRDGCRHWPVGLNEASTKRILSDAFRGAYIALRGMYGTMHHVRWQRTYTKRKKAWKKRGRLVTYFGKWDLRLLKRVYRRVRDLWRRINTRKYTAVITPMPTGGPDPACSTNTALASSGPGQWRIYICTPFWAGGESTSRTIERAGTIVHELVHNLGFMKHHTRHDDDEAQALAKDHRFDAAKNAANYQFYVERYLKDIKFK